MSRKDVFLLDISAGSPSAVGDDVKLGRTSSFPRCLDAPGVDPWQEVLALTDVKDF